MTHNDDRRRALLGAGGLLAAGGAMLAAGTRSADAAKRATRTRGGTHGVATLADFGIEPDVPRDQTAALQRAIDRTAERGVPLLIPAGHYQTRTLTLRSGTRLLGVGPASILTSIGVDAVLSAEDAVSVAIEDLTVAANNRPVTSDRAGAITTQAVGTVTLRDVVVSAPAAHGIALYRCGGTLDGLTVTGAGQAGVFCLDGRAVMITGCTISDCANNGILVWQSAPGDDGAIITDNRISNIRSESGGTGQNGNAINVFRANGVTVSGNRMTDCAYSAIRANTSSNVVMTSNQARNIGEVALYAEFAFSGAVIAQNVVEQAATGVSVTNFNDGGRLAVVQGNLIRNLRRREFEPVDKRGNGIAVEADTAITGNVVEGAPTAGIWIGTRQFMRNVSATGNVVRSSGIGIAVSDDRGAGAALIANN
ncbi:MAG: TIGR03808 family TAT-translocated repetitive protein, partial [Pseudomonadota bacterium]